MAYQRSIEVPTRGRGTMNITAEVERIAQAAGIETGVVHVFVQHTSCALIITENADPDVRRDLETLAQRWAPDGDPAYRRHGHRLAPSAQVRITEISCASPTVDERRANARRSTRRRSMTHLNLAHLATGSACTP